MSDPIPFDPGYKGESELLAKAIYRTIEQFPHMTVTEVIGTLFTVILDLYRLL